MAAVVGIVRRHFARCRAIFDESRKRFRVVIRKQRKWRNAPIPMTIGAVFHEDWRNDFSVRRRRIHRRFYTTGRIEDARDLIARIIGVIFRSARATSDGDKREKTTCSRNGERFASHTPETREEVEK